MNKKNLRQEKGITLIALVITIIVMLILVSVTITIAVNGGLFNYARKAGVETNEAKDAEQDMATLEPGMSTEELIAKYTKDVIPYSTTLLDENGILTKTVKYTDKNGVTAIIPKGFNVSSVTSEQTVAGGLVIQDEIGNEFVWIPVPKDTFIRTWFYNNMTFEEIAASEDTTLRSSFFTNYKNQDTSLNSYSSYTDAIAGIGSWKEIVSIVKNKLMADYSEPYTGAADWEKTEYSNMVTSVTKYGGFYIGRYETGKKENDKIVVKKNKQTYSTTWGTNMTTIGTTGAVYLSQTMYTGEDYGAASTLCYGVQWDSILRFIKDVVDVTDGTNWGNYTDPTTGSDSLINTGSNETYKAKNIYDIAGNRQEWTMEAKTSQYRGQYGGGRYSYGTEYPPSDKRAWTPNSNDNMGFRVALYVK